MIQIRLEERVLDSGVYIIPACMYLHSPNDILGLIINYRQTRYFGLCNVMYVYILRACH